MYAKHLSIVCMHTFIDGNIKVYTYIYYFIWMIQFFAVDDALASARCIWCK